MSEGRTIKGLIEDGHCYLDVAFGIFTPDGVQVRMKPLERATLNTYSPGPVLPALAEKLGLEMEGDAAGNGGPRTGGKAWVYIAVYDGDNIVWDGRSHALFMPKCLPLVGFQQMMEWEVSIDGPGGTFEVTFPPRLARDGEDASPARPE